MRLIATLILWMLLQTTSLCKHNALIINAGRAVLGLENLKTALEKNYTTTLLNDPKINAQQLRQALQAAARDGSGKLIICLFGNGFAQSCSEFLELPQTATAAHQTVAVDSLLLQIFEASARPVIFITAIAARAQPLKSREFCYWHCPPNMKKSERRFVYITASGGREMATSLPDGWDVFTFHLCQLLDDAEIQRSLDFDHDRLLLLSDVFDFLEKKTKSANARFSNGQSIATPVIHRISGEGMDELIFWKNKAPKTPKFLEKTPDAAPLDEAQEILKTDNCTDHYLRVEGKNPRRADREVPFQKSNEIFVASDLATWAAYPTAKNFALLLIADDRCGECEKLKRELVAAPETRPSFLPEGSVQLIFLDADWATALLDRNALDSQQSPFGTQNRDFLRTHLAREISRTPTFFFLKKSGTRLTDVHELAGYHRPENLQFFMQKIISEK